MYSFLSSGGESGLALDAVVCDVAVVLGKFAYDSAQAQLDVLRYAQFVHHVWPRVWDSVGTADSQPESESEYCAVLSGVWTAWLTKSNDAAAFKSEPISMAPIQTSLRVRTCAIYALHRLATRAMPSSLTLLRVSPSVLAAIKHFAHTSEINNSSINRPKSIGNNAPINESPALLRHLLRLNAFCVVAVDYISNLNAWFNKKKSKNLSPNSISEIHDALVSDLVFNCQLLFPFDELPDNQQQKPLYNSNSDAEDIDDNDFHLLIRQYQDAYQETNFFSENSFSFDLAARCHDLETARTEYSNARLQLMSHSRQSTIIDDGAAKIESELTAYYRVRMKMLGIIL
ncbi:hypothetical protein HK100_000052 [Physocladia obscura]|uniref:Uncharacterized protein n=1 Tax=Physocladia obscura TaxID=109957 RepID=A0AAD5XH84_9FUNG|nr:hypothetical protein HK100_000052 [Physocladia obscura]